MIKQEQIIRKVTSIGNGAHIFAPKEWIEDKVVVIRIPKQPINEQILNTLNPYLEFIEGVFLYGSYSRNEENSESDIDVLVITNKKISIKRENYEIISLQKKDIEKAINISPILIYSALAEAKPIINSGLLDELKKRYRIKDKEIKKYLKETKKIIKINQKYPSLYSLVLRLRGLYIVKQLLSGEKYSKKKFESSILKNLPEINTKKIMNYKNDFKLTEKEANSLINLLKEKVLELEKKW